MSRRNGGHNPYGPSGDFRIRCRPSAQRGSGRACAGAQTDHPGGADGLAAASAQYQLGPGPLQVRMMPLVLVGRNHVNGETEADDHVLSTWLLVDPVVGERKSRPCVVSNELCLLIESLLPVPGRRGSRAVRGYGAGRPCAGSYWCYIPAFGIPAPGVVPGRSGLSVMPQIQRASEKPVSGKLPGSGVVVHFRGLGCAGCLPVTRRIFPIRSGRSSVRWFRRSGPVGGRRNTRGGRSSTRWCTGCGPAVPGGCCRMICHRGRRSTTTGGDGSKKACGSGC